MRSRFWRRGVPAAAVVLVLLAAVLLWPTAVALIAPATVTVVAAGNMACDPADPDQRPDAAAGGARCRAQAVSDLAVARKPDFLIALGDIQFEVPTSAAFRDVYGPAYGRMRDRTVPVFGNQEYRVQDADSLLTYFDDQVRDARGYWSQDLGPWHLVVLNSNCSAVAGGCDDGSPQQTWLATDLAGNDDRCTIAVWHHPRWSTGIAGHDPRTADLFRTLYDHQVELVLSAHDADYERFAPLDPDGRPDERGVRQFVVGTGGQAHYRPDSGPPRGGPAGAFVDYDHHGVLELRLSPQTYRWGFHPLEATTAVEDEGSASCF